MKKLNLAKFTNNNGLMTKIIYLKGDGIEKQPVADLYEGTCERLTLDGLRGLSATIKSLEPNQALTYGVPKQQGGIISVTTAANVVDGLMARSREYMQWSEGAGLMMLDYDPQPGTTPLKSLELVGTIRAAVPGLASVAMLWTPSASSGITSEDGVINTGISGQRLYMVVADASLIPDLGNIIFNRLILAGHGYVFHSITGAVSVRTIADATVWQPEHLDFAAGASCGEGLSRNTVDHKLWQGDVLHTLTPLTKTELKQLESIKQKLKADGQPHADELKVAYSDRKVAELVAGGLDEAKAAEAVEQALSDDSAVLPPEWIVTLNSGEQLSCADLCHQHEKHDGMSMRDPIDPTYGTSRAKFYWNNGNPTIHSLAHGVSKTYALQLSADLMFADVAGVQRTAMDDVVDRLAKLPPLEYDKVRQAEAKALKVRTLTLDAAVSEIQKAAQEHQSMFADIEPWKDEVNGLELLNEITNTIRRYIVTPDNAAEAVALWVLNTYVHDASYHSPIVLISSPEKRCGKSNLLSLMDELSNRPLLAANISPAAVYRAIEQWKPTLLIDEADTFLKQNDDMAGVINSGHTKKTAFVIRCDGDTNEPRRFSTWCPKVIAGIGSQRDTLEDRSIIIPLRRKLVSDSVERLRLDRNSFGDIQRKCIRWGVDNFQTVRDSDPTTPKGLHDRAADNWTPLFAIADLCGWRERAELAALTLSGTDDGESINAILLKDIRDIFKSLGTTRLSSHQICEHLAKIDDRPWAEWSRGKAISTNKLAGRLKQFGIHSKTIRLESNDRLKGYALESFKDAFSRYIQDSKRDTVTSEGAQGFQPISKRDNNLNVTDKKTLKPLQVNDCHVVTFQDKPPPKLPLHDRSNPSFY